MRSDTNNIIFLVEDDLELASLTQDYLQKQGFTVVVEKDGAYAVEHIIQRQPACVLLDIMLPNKDGFAICKELRVATNGYQGPILMLTARDEDIDQLLGLELGADDYVTKPVQPRLLLARIHTLLRRVNPSQTTPPQGLLVFDQLSIDAGARRVLLENNPIDLSTAEFDLLFLLATHAGIVLTRDDILKHLRGIGYDGTDRSIDLRISRLRKKLSDEKQCDSQKIKTVRGSGYLFAKSYQH
ncbi:MAG: response regulator [Cocleimonas sp.]